MPRSDFDVITGPPAPIRPIPPASLPAAPGTKATAPERRSDRPSAAKPHPPLVADP
jgi:hypothetical protein